MLTYEYKVDGTTRQYAAIDEAIRTVPRDAQRDGAPHQEAGLGFVRKSIISP